MKTIIISLAIVALCFAAHAGNNSLKYIITDNDTLICKNLKRGFVYTKYIFHSGGKSVISKKEINRVCKNEIKDYKCDFFRTNRGQVNILISFYKNSEWINSIYCNNIGEMYAYIDQYSENGNLLLKK